MDSKLSWDDLKTIIKKQKLEKLKRSSEQERVYQASILFIRKHFKSIYDFILYSKFDYELEPFKTKEIGINVESQQEDLDSLNPEITKMSQTFPLPPEGYVWKSVGPDKHDCQPSRLVLNDFPYYFEENIEHWVYWKLGSNITESEIKNTINIFSQDKNYLEISFWINPLHLKSLPDIDHVHFVCLRKNKVVSDTRPSI